MQIGRLGVWTWLDGMSGPQAAEFARELEEWGYTALWVPEAIGPDPFAMLAYLAAEFPECRSTSDVSVDAVPADSIDVCGV